jgi:hypothetical protein
MNSMKKLLYARGEFIYVPWCCLREASSDSQNADEAPRVLLRGPTLATTKATGQVLSNKASALYSSLLCTRSNLYSERYGPASINAS